MAVAGTSAVLLIVVLSLVGADMWKDKVHLSCDSTGMRVELAGGPDGVPFKGLMWIEGSEDPSCSVRGTGKGPTVMYIPYEACNTHKASNSLYMNRVSFKQRAGLVSSRDSIIEVVCRLKPGNVRVNSEKTVFSIITDGVVDISRRVSMPDILQPSAQDVNNRQAAPGQDIEPAQPNVKLLRDNISGRNRLSLDIRLPKRTNANSTTVRNCTILQDNIVISKLDQRYPRRAFHRLRPSSNRVVNKNQATNNIC